MGPWKFLPLFLLANSVFGQDIPSFEEITDRFSKFEVKYTSQHEIVNMILPFTRFSETFCDTGSDSLRAPTVFFVEADMNGEEVTYLGMYVLKNGTATKILDNGRDVTALDVKSKRAYIGASDGIYIYDDTDGTTKKFGNINDNIIQVETDELAKIIYFVTNDNQVFFVDNKTKEKKKMNRLKSVKTMVTDLDGNVYYYDTKNDLYVYNNYSAKQFESIPRGNKVKLGKSVIGDKIVIIYAVVDNTMYALNSDGTFRKNKEFSNLNNLTAFAPDAGLVLYFASEKNMYALDGTQAFCAKRNLLMYLSYGDPNLRDLLSNNPFFG